MTSRPEAELGVRSLQLALRILEAVAFAGEPLGVTQIANRVGATKGSVHRHLVTFVEQAYLIQDPHNATYSLGAKSRLLSHVAPETDLLQLAHGPMHELRDTLGHSVVLSAMSPRGAFVMATVPSRWPIEIGVRPGSELSFHASAQGKILLAFSPRPYRERMLSRPLEPFTTRTVVDRAILEEQLDVAMKAGYAAAPEEVLLGIDALAAPIFDHADACIACVALVGSIQHLPNPPEQNAVQALKDCAQKISRKLGHGREARGVIALEQRWTRAGP